MGFIIGDNVGDAGSSTPDQAAGGADVIDDATTETFGQKVIEASMATPVLVDFWAPWCGPCKQLTPTLEKVVKAARGAVKLVKINIDNEPQLAQQLRIQSIPTVYAFFQGRPVDAFQGAVPESQIKQVVDQLAKLGGGEAGPSPIDDAMAQANAALDQGDAAVAAQIFGEILRHEPETLEAIAGLAKCYVMGDRVEEAKALLANLTAEQARDQTIVSVKAMIELAEQGIDVARLPTLSAQVESNPDDHQARFDLAMVLYASGQQEGAMDALLEIIRRDREWNEEGARKQLVQFFEALGPTDPLTISTRRKLSSILFS